jgi:NAD(P)-dependent dehydrogenase (short-subunit alcohol dehydrogenase family)
MAAVRRLEDKVAIVTGGASGIGAATVRRFCAEGARVVVGDVDDAAGAAVLEQVRSEGGHAVYRTCDVTQEADVEALCELAFVQFGSLDVMFNNAGIAGFPLPLLDTDVALWDEIVAVDLRGVFLGVKHAARRMRDNRIEGSIISTASVAGLGGGRGPCAYSAAKAGVINLTRQAAIELAPLGIRVNCIAPGGIVTPIFTRHVPEDFIEPILAKAQPIARAGRPEDVAHAALYLASDESSFVSGECLVVDGALTAGSRNPMLGGTVEEMAGRMQGGAGQG